MKIGIPISASKTQFYINMAYIEYAVEAGLEPVIITPQNDTKEMAEFCDGLMLPGGIDVNPIFYGEENYSSYKVDPDKDDFERRTLHMFRELGKPVFGICRGFQLIIREFMKFNREPHDSWFSFSQHIDHHSLATDLDLPRDVPSHRVTYSGMMYGEGGNQKKMFVNSMHHQALMLALPKIKKPKKQSGKVGSPVEIMNGLGNLIDILAVARYGLKANDTDVIVEAFAITWGQSRMLAVQWHPEELKDYKLLQSFFRIKTEESSAAAGGA